MSHACAAASNAALDSGLESSIARAGGAEAVVAVMRRHARVPHVAVRGAWALRNLAGSPEHQVRHTAVAAMM